MTTTNQEAIGMTTKDLSDVETKCSQKFYVLRAIEGKGQGLIATSDISKGTRILSESPIFTVPRDTNDLMKVRKAITDGLRCCSKDQQRAFFALHNCHTADRDPLLDIARTNILPLGSAALKGGLFLEASRINHSCKQNSQNTWNANLEQITIHAFTDIRKGDEITINYLPGSMNYFARQTHLERYFGFRCSCELCLLPSELRRTSDERLDEITRLDELIGDGLRIVQAPQACLRDARKLLQLLAEEAVSDARVPRLYYDAFQIVIANGDQARAMIFAERALAARTVLEGDDSPDSLKLKNLIQAPGTHSLYGMSMRWARSKEERPQDLGLKEFDSWLWKSK